MFSQIVKAAAKAPVKSTFNVTRAMSTGARDVFLGQEARDKMRIGVNILADAVECTLGPAGRNVCIGSSFGAPKITKDGVSVARAIDLACPMKNLGAQLIKSVAQKTNDLAGDGTTTSTVLARAIFNEGSKAIAAGMNPTEIRIGIMAATEAVVEAINKQSRKVQSKGEIAQVATISANGDVAIGKLLADAMEFVGKDGVITVQEGKTVHDELEVVEGLKFDRGFISPYFITNTKNQKVEYEAPFLLLVDGKITNLNDLLPIFEAVAKAGRPFVIVAEDVEGDALAALILNKLRGSARVAAIKAPGFGDNRKKTLQDIAVLTGGQVVCEETGMRLSEVGTEVLGSCKKITISKDDTIILDGAGGKNDIEARCGEIRSAIASCTSEYEREKYQERLAKLSGGVAVIKVGGVSEVEVGEKKDRIDDALNATRAAVEEGIVPGGGCALLYASQTLDAVRNSMVNSDQQTGVDIVRHALAVPAKAIVKNAGIDGGLVIGKLLDEANGDAMCTLGVDFRVGLGSSKKYKIVDMFEAGIVDPAKVVRCALTDAAGVASLMTTTEAIIVDAPKPAGSGMPAPPANPMGGMGGMF
jgi:chaperonin GroEL